MYDVGSELGYDYFLSTINGQRVKASEKMLYHIPDEIRAWDMSVYYWFGTPFSRWWR